MDQRAIDELIAGMQAMGATPEVLAMARANPAMLQQAMRQSLDTRSSLSTITSNTQWEDQFKTYLEQAKKQYDRQKDAVPRPGVAPPRQRLISNVESQRASVMQNQALAQEGTSIMYSITGITKNFCTTPLSDLKPITLSQMLVHKTHKGHYLLGRIVARPSVIVGITFGIEDIEGKTEWLSLYNVFLDGTKTGDELDRMFPLGTVFALLEPTWKENASGTSTMLRADSPTDFVVLYPDHDLIRSIKWRTSLLSGAFPSSRDFKAEGNRYFAQKKYLLAVKCWTDGIGNTTDSDKLAILHFNRSQANLLLEQYGAAHRDSTRAVELFDPSTPIATTAKALIRSARALEGLRFLDKALKAYDEVLKVVPTSVEARNEKARLERRVKSATTGDYDWSELLDMKLKDGDSLMEGDFVGPIKVTTVAGRGGGRGVLAARDIEVGELLLFEKALCIGKPPPNNSKLVFAFNLRTSQASESSKIDLVERLATKLVDDPSLQVRIECLFAGPRHSLSPFPSRAPRLSDRPQSDHKVYVDTGRIEDVTYYNSFGLKVDSGDGVSQSKSGKMDSPSALFAVASLFNHSCLPNALWRIVGDCMVVRTSQRIAAGAEIVMPYVSGRDHDRKKVLNKFLDSKDCDCPLCKLDRADGPNRLAKRGELLETLPMLSKDVAEVRAGICTTPPSLLLKRAVKLISDLEATLSPSRLARLDWSSPCPAIADAYHVASNAVALGRLEEASVLRAINYDLKALTVLGCKIDINAPQPVIAVPADTTSLAVEVLIQTTTAYSFVGEHALAVKWMKAAIAMEAVVTGGDKACFKKRYGALLEKSGVDHLL